MDRRREGNATSICIREKAKDEPADKTMLCFHSAILIMKSSGTRREPDIKILEEVIDDSVAANPTSPLSSHGGPHPE